MASLRPEFTWENGFQEQAADEAPASTNVVDGYASDAYVQPPSVDLVTSPMHNDKGINVLRDWPTIFNGTNNPHGIPSWWKPQEKVDVLIVGAGPSGLGIAVSLARQGVSFRIIDKAETPLVAGRADGVQPRFLETISTWGLADEVAEEGPLIERTALYRDGEKLIFGRSHQSDSRYRGLHIITQGQVERIYIRDLLRHKSIVERSTTLADFKVDVNITPDSYPVSGTICNHKTGALSPIQAKFVVGTDGGASSIRKAMNIPFDGVSTDIYWGILDAIIETDYPHAWMFGTVMSTEHGCCCIIPREDGYIRIYTKLDTSHTGPLGTSRQAKDPTFAESGGHVDAHSITPDEVLEQANRIFSPYKLKFGSTLSWFAIWKISERVARRFSSPDQRVHLAGDAAHIHSVMGAFGLNASILDAANLGWKLGLASRGHGKIDSLLPTYNSERRKHAARIIKVSGEYLRWICGSPLAVADLSDIEALEAADKGEKSSSHVVQQIFSGQPKGSVRVKKQAGIGDPSGLLNGPTKGETNGLLKVQPKTNGHTNGYTNGNANGDTNGQTNGHVNGHTNGHTNGYTNGHTNGAANGDSEDGSDRDSRRAKDFAFISSFFAENGKFLLGVDCPYDESVLAPPTADRQQRPIGVRNGVRAPNPRVCFATNRTGYLYDKMAGPTRLHVVAFASALGGSEVRRQITKFVQGLEDPAGWFQRYGGSSIFNVVLVTKLLPFEYEQLRESEPQMLAALDKAGATVVFDDRPPDEDAHYTYGVNHRTGGVAVVRPDLWMGTTCYPEETEQLGDYFGGFLNAV